MAYDSVRYCEYYEGDLCTGGFRTARRMSAISGPFGYLVHPTYFSDDLEDGSYLLNWYNLTDYKLINTSVENCSTSCVNNWPGSANPNHLVNSYVSGSGVITGVRRPGSTANDLTITYASGKVSAVADHAGTTTYAYADASGNRTVTVTNSLSQVSTYTFLITSERLTKFKDPLNNETNYTYDGSGRLTRITRPEGNYTNFTYDARGNVTEVRHVGKPGSGATDITATAAFPSPCANPKTCNSPTSTTDARGNTTDFTYDSTHGGVLTVTAPAPTAGATRPKQTFTYVAQSGITLPASVSQCASQASCAGTADEVKSTVTYGASGGGKFQPVQVSSGNGTGTLTATTQLAYDIYGNLTSIDGPLAGVDDTTTAVYDGLRRQVGTISPDPDGAGGRPHVAQRRVFATNGDLTLVQVGTTPDATPSGWAAFASAFHRFFLYDANGRVIRTTLWSSGVDYEVADFLYDSENRRTCAIQYMNPAVWGPQASACAPLQTNGPNGPDRVSKTLYDANGRPTDVLVAVGVSGQEATERKLAYSNNGVLAHLIDANNNARPMNMTATTGW